MKIVINNSTLRFGNFKVQTFAEVEIQKGQISGGNWSTSNPLNRTFKVVEMGYTGTLTLKTNSNVSSSVNGYIAFLGEPLSIVDGATANVILGKYLTKAEQELTLDIPDGTKYCYVMFTIANGTDVAPTSIKYGNKVLL